MMAVRLMTDAAPPPARLPSGGRRRLLGTFGGVFTPSILTILGLILLSASTRRGLLLEIE